MDFKDKFTFEQRKKESDKIKSKYNNRIPIIVQKSTSCKDLNNLDKQKFLVPSDLTMGQFIFVIRKRLKLSHEKALFFFINNSLPSTNQSLIDINNKYMDDDGFLYITYSSENTFGFF